MMPISGLTENALTVLRNRYLVKDEHGEPVEAPEELFRRVARNLVLIDLLYEQEVYDRAGGQPKDLAATAGTPAADARGAGRSAAAKLAPPYTSYDLSTLAHAYRGLASHGHMKVAFPKVLELLGDRRPALAAREDGLYEVTAGLLLLFNSPTLMNAGRELQQLSACFVLPVTDSLGGIFDTLKHTALIHQSGGGTGFSFSRLRPKDDIVKSTGGVASGPISFMRVFDAATNAIKQGGTRRGANMGILRCDHPDILEFIRCKTGDGDITNFNLSVALTDSFMEAVQTDGSYDLKNPRTGAVASTLKARRVFDLISERAWANGEPGVVFIDRINAANPTPNAGAIESTNPCGEQPLLPYESCNLASVNLGRLVSDGKVDYETLGRVVDLAVHYLDNVIDGNRYPMPEIERMTKANRKIGLGVMGWADMLIQLGLSYDSEAAVALAGEVMGFISRRSRAASVDLAGARGPFPNFPGSALEGAGQPPVRNATTTTIAPTGTISIVAGASGGIEPLFSVAFTRRGILGGQVLVETNPVFEETARRQGFHSEALMAKVAEAGSVAGLQEVPEAVKRLFVTALDIGSEWHIRMQAAFQAHTDNAVSKTVNLPFEATAEDIRSIYEQAYELGCKGVTVYRNGSRETQVLNVGRQDRPKLSAEKPTAETRPVIDRGRWGRVRPVPRPVGLAGVTVRKHTPLGNVYLTLNTADGLPFELFAQLGRAGSDVAAFTEGIARLVSLALRCGVDPQEVADELAGIGGQRSVGFGPNRVKSVPDAISQFLGEYLDGKVDVSALAASRSGQLLLFGDGPEAPDGAGEPDSGPGGPDGGGVGEDGTGYSYPGGAGRASSDSSGEVLRARRGLDLCPVCGMHGLAYEEGCLKCRSCGYSEC